MASFNLVRNYNHRAAIVGMGIMLMGLLNAGLFFMPFPWLNLTIALLTVIILPGWLLIDLLFLPDEFLPLARIPIAFVIGLGLLSPPAVAMLFLGANLSQFGWVIVGINLVVGGVWWWVDCNQKVLPRNSFVYEPASWILWAIVALASIGAILLFLATASTFNFADAPGYLSYLRHYLEQPLTTAISPLPIEAGTSARAINGWWVILVLLVRLSGAELLDVYFWYLPPLLMIMSLLAFYSLGVTLFQNKTTALLAVLLQLLYVLSNINSHDLIGNGFFDRILEDKFMIWLVLLPIAQLLVVRYLQSGGVRRLLAVGAGVVALGLTHPIGVALFGISVAAFTPLYMWFNWSRETIRRVALLASPLLLLVFVPWLQRQIMQRQGVGFRYVDGSLMQQQLNQTRLWVFSAVDNVFMSHPHLVTHPFTLLAILLTPLLILHLRRSVAAQFLFANMAAPLLLLYNPMTTPMLGQLITPWMLWRVSWLLPITLTLGFFIHYLGELLHSRWAGKSLAIITSKSPILIPLVVIAALGLLINPYISDSWYRLKERTTANITPEVQDLLTQLPQQTAPGDIVLAPSNNLTNMIPSFTSQVKLLRFRWDGELPWATFDHFYQTRLVTPATMHLLKNWQVDFIIVERDQPLAFQLAGLPVLFTRHYQNDLYVLYRVQPDPAVEPIIQGNDYLLQNNLMQAEATYRQALVLDPTSGPAQFGLALTYQAQDQVDTAQEFLDRLLATQPDHLPARLNLAQLYQQMGQDEAALAELKEAHSTWPNSLRVAEMLGDAYLALGQPDQAIVAYNQAVSQPPTVTPGQYHLSLADLYQRKGLSAAAQAEFQTVVNLDALPGLGLNPTFLTGIQRLYNPRLARLNQAYKALAHYQQQAGNYPAAEFFYRQAIAQLPNDQSAYTSLASLYLLEFRTEEVAKLYQQAIRRNPNVAWPHLELGRLYIETQSNIADLGF